MAPARQAGFAAGLPKEVPATTAEQDVRLGHEGRDVRLGLRLRWAGSDIVVAGRHGIDDQTRRISCPPCAAGARIGHQSAQDHMFLDGLEDAYEQGAA